MLQDYIAVDLEMTGLNPKTDEILEIGAVKVKDKQTADTFSALIRVEKEIDAEIEELTGITTEMSRQGEELDTAVRRFMEFAEDLVWVGHNVIYDYSFLKQWAVNHKIEFEKEAADTLKIARKCLPQLEKKSLDALCEYYKIGDGKMHRAFVDAKATAELYEKLEAEFSENEAEIFMPKPLLWKTKKQTPATARQKNYLNELAKYHNIVIDSSVEKLSRSEASRLTDRLLRQYGRIPTYEERKNEKARPSDSGRL